MDNKKKYAKCIAKLQKIIRETQEDMDIFTIERIAIGFQPDIGRYKQRLENRLDVALTLFMEIRNISGNNEQSLEEPREMISYFDRDRRYFQGKLDDYSRRRNA